MRKFGFLFLLFMSLFMFNACTTVDSGHTAVRIEYGGSTHMERVYPEGIYFGLNWLFDGTVEYETRQQTLLVQDTFLDVDGLKVPIDAVIYFTPMKDSVNKLHKDIGPNYVQTKVVHAVNTALKAVIPRYKALELNSRYREHADSSLLELLEVSLPKFLVECQGVNITKVDVPKEISEQIIKKQVQDEKNALAEKMEIEQKNLANAQIARARGEYDAAVFDAKTKDILSQPKMVELYRAETERMWAEKGVSPYGNNNVFGFDPRSGTMMLNRK